MLATLFLTLLLAQPDPAALTRLKDAAGLFAQGQPQPALAIVDEVLAKDPRQPEALVLRALLLDALGRPRDAQIAYEAALQVLPNDAKLLRLFGEHWLRRGQRRQAITFLERSQVVAPDERTSRLLEEARKPGTGSQAPSARGARRSVGATAPPASAAAEADPYALVQQANAHLEKGEYQAVLDIVDGLLRRYPKSQSSHLLRALALDGLDRPDEARRSFEAAQSVAPKDPQILFLFGKHYLTRAQWDDAIRCLEQSSALAPDSVDTLFYLAQARFHTINKAAALEAIERCAELAPNNATILVKLGEYRAQARKLSPALEALQKAQAINPDEPGLDLALGIVQLNSLDVNAALAALERAAARDPENLAVLTNLAEACTQARDYAAAKRYYQTLLDRGQLDANNYLGLGKALVGLGEQQAAVAPLMRAIELNPKLSEVHFHLARAYRTAGRVEDSQRELRIFSALRENPFGAFEDRPDAEQAAWRRVEALVKDGKEREALDMIGKISPMNDAQPGTFVVGALYYTQRRYQDAERLLTQAVSASPNLLKAHAFLALTYLELGRLPEAERALAIEMERDPKDAFTLMANGKLQFRKQSWAEAVRYLRDSHVVEAGVQLMLCEALLQLGQRDQALETAQLIATLSVTDPSLRPELDQLLARFSVKLEPDAAETKPPAQ